MDLNSRMNLGDAESNFFGSFVPITPEKAITADSTRILMNGHGSQMGRENWEGISGFSNPNYDNGLYTQALQNESADWNGSFLSLLEMGNDADEFLLPNQTQCSDSNILPGIPQYGFPVPYTPQYDLNLLPTMETCGAPSLTNLSQFEPATPNAKRTNEREKPQYNLNIPVPSENHVDISSEILSLLSEEPKDPVISTSIQEPKDSGILSEDIIDLNQTPQSKTPKRRKHRPKVIVEGKSKRTPKAMKMADPEKRKYVRKVQQETATSQPGSSEKPKEKRKYVRKDLKEPAPEIAEPSCKKSLNFDPENVVSEREKNVFSQQQQVLNKEAEISKLSAEFRVIDPIIPAGKIGRREPSLPINQQSELRSNLAPSMNLMADNNASNSGRRPDLNFSSRDSKFANQQFLSSDDRAGQRLFHYNPQSQFSPFLHGSGRSKREYYQIGTNSHNRREMYPTDGYHQNSHIPNDAYLETRKRKKIENGNIANIGGISRLVTAVDHSRRNSGIPNLNLNMNTVRRESNESLRFPVHSPTTHLVASGQEKSKQIMTRPEENFRAIMLQTLASANPFMAYNMIPPTPRASSRHQDTCHPTNSVNLSRKEIVPMRQPEMQVLNDGRRKGQAAKQKFLVAVEEIISKMESLNLNESQALVPFKGDGSLIPFEGIVKKRKPRPKVDLDSETERVWKLLMWKEGSEDMGTDEEKRKWWEEERRVFRGRADSFIARMHLVQGDRRFSKWKGSVVDSVIGVFLTQNVSDHLSSSAFMCLAAKFPPKRTTDRTRQRDGTIVLVEEPEISLPNLNEKLQEKLLRHPFYAHSSIPPYGIEEQQLESETSCTGRTGRPKEYSQSPEEVLSSQDSIDSSVSQIVGFRSYSGSNSEAEEPANVNKSSKNHSTSSVDLRVESFSEFYSNISGMSLFPEDSRRPEYCQKMSNPFNPQIYPTVPSSNYTTSHSGVLNSHREESISSWQSGTSGTVQGAENVVRLTGTSSQSSNEPVNLASSIPTGKFSKDRVKDKVDSNVKTDNAKKERGKDSNGEKGTFDWDILRKQVLGNSECKRKGKDAMDSLDYEAMRSASVSQISDTIRERGMNNMLAERIKEFLERLVRDHGSVDLEWLRDVPPDKAKEYLLSIRGLGLKSVECVRLLTLHHLAFPVDTNVGRIAVRLGWVPLQPLPESLQLHLLELYPILESIQKYLWPRLCKLDQRTLYELHYQMITFGKVFCTKSRPNCNACPMRAECRHFASAFASARLALPGPEEKSIVTHTTPLTTEGGPQIIINPMPLLPPQENNLRRVETASVSCLPIIEEPATPEQEQIEVLESEIEDFFNDETDEIPTIKLNMEELSVNLQNYMQENMDLQEFDVSKALVALNPNAASIPTTKLKYVSRLRTEHNVYELPDSHPLLNGMDKREPDDPSPYLLAIWTPGETAESIQPPGKQCQSQESGILCNEKTCFSCNSIREANSQIVRGTLLVPCRTAMRGSFPLNGTYFQVNEMFADHASSVDPIDVPRAWIWNLPRRMVYFGTSVSTIFRGLSTEEIQYCFWRGFVCVRGFDQKSRAPRPLLARLHFPASKLAKNKNVA